ncbi:MAG: hypothetical protein IRZ02_03825 [Acidothermus sp.]|nr:hypothetical protein [Acidothermus sp.]MCL6537329.1 hypothetical protein [Acidothermus sp.]
MYGWIWRKLPGNTAEKCVTVGAMVLAILALLFFVVFPWVEPRLPWNDVTIESPSLSSPHPIGTSPP